MKKFIVTLTLEKPIDQAFEKLLPQHQRLIGKLLSTEKIETYSVNVDMNKAWVLMLADSRKDSLKIIHSFPIIHYLDIDIEELAVYENALNALPRIIMN